MVENIALIPEVHQRMSIKKAETLALDKLQVLNLQSIAMQRLNNCTAEEIFYVMYIRALMMPQNDLVIKVPYAITESLKDIQSIIKTMLKLQSDKNIIILDLLGNEVYYEGSLCNIMR